MSSGIEAAMLGASRPAQHYDPALNPDYLRPIQPKNKVTNIKHGRTLTTMIVDDSEEPVPRPTDMTRQIPRKNKGTPHDLGGHMRVAKIAHNVNHVPRREPVVVHGLNSLANSHANVITKDAEFFGEQRSVPGLKDSLNYDPLDQISKDMLRINKADATEKITVKGGLHNTSVTRSRTRKPSGKTYL